MVPIFEIEVLEVPSILTGTTVLRRLKIKRVEWKIVNIVIMAVLPSDAFNDIFFCMLRRKAGVRGLYYLQWLCGNRVGAIFRDIYFGINAGESHVWENMGKNKKSLA